MNSMGYGAWKGRYEGAGYLRMLPAALQFLVVMIASAINDRLQRKLDYVAEERRILWEKVEALTEGKKISFTAQQRRLAEAGKLLSLRNAGGVASSSSRRIRARVSVSIGGRPTGRRERRRQTSFHRERCHRRTFCGRTMATAARSEGNTLVMPEMASRSRTLSRGAGRPSVGTMSCWRRRAFSARRAARERSRLMRARARLVIGS